ncbi:MAG TPA: hypothetical protein VF135_08295 [Terriglobales bacterium]
MRTLTVLLVSAVMFSLASSAQSRTKHKPSAAVHGVPSSAPKAPANGPVYADEMQPAPALQQRPARVAKPSKSPADLPVGTAIWMTLDATLSTTDGREGEEFSAHVSRPVTMNGIPVIPVDSIVTGHLTRIRDPRRIAGTGSLRLAPEIVKLPDGSSFPINATVVDTSTPKKLTVDDEGRIKAKGVNSGDKVEMIAGTGTGGIVGTIAAGGKGLLFGSMIGGGAAAVHWLTKRHPVEIPAGTELIIEINRPLAGTTLAMNTGD